MGSRLDLASIARRILAGWFWTLVAALSSLMVADKVRKIVRGANVEPLPANRHESLTLSDGSDITLYTSGEVLYDDMLDAIDSAEHRVLFESYIVKGDVVGSRFRAALRRAAERGVRVHVIYDGFANLVVRRSFFDYGPNIEIMRYPLWNGGVSSLWNPRMWGRDHRKILVIDDKIGFVGGYNIGALYSTQWRDTHLKVQGPAVWDLDNAFVDFWNAQRSSSQRTFALSRLEQAGEASWRLNVRAHRNVPRNLLYPIRGMYLEALDRAKTSVDITAAYFIPDHDILAAIIDASHRGVRVRIVVSKVSNHVVTDWLSRGFYSRLLQAGVEIYRYQDHMVHAKTATIDGQWSTVGTANIDRLSLLGNYEINLEILDPQFAAAMQRTFEDDLVKCDRLDLRKWESRPLVARAYELILRPLRRLL